MNGGTLSISQVALKLLANRLALALISVESGLRALSVLVVYPLAICA